jgi:membrane protease YdiL (CAAX protease family)
MKISDMLFNREGRVRSVWRLAIFAVTTIALTLFLFLVTALGLAVILPRPTVEWFLFKSDWGFVVQSVFLFFPAALFGWACGYLLEDLPWRALGWALHRGWMKDVLFGLLVGAASVGVAAAAGAVFGGYRFSVPAQFDTSAMAKTFFSSCIIFMLGAASEEMLFRGYALQTLMRSWPLWVALIPVSVPFALGHLWNPNVVPGFTFANTVLAGVWLAVAYWRTRSLWFPFGIHWGWNFMQGAILGSPVSGITKITPAPLLHFVDKGPAWIGGGTYGIEGGAACTLALIISTLFIWRVPLVSATPEMKRFTDGENPLAATRGSEPPAVAGG